MLIRTLLIVAFLATPLASSAASLDLSKWTGTAATIVKVVDAADGTFHTHKRWWKHWHWKPKPKSKPKPKPGPVGAVPEPTAALLFGLGAVALGVGIRRRR